MQKCHNFNVAKNTLLENADLITKEYIENFIKDFLCISNETLKQENFEVTKRVPIEKLHIVKNYSKSEKNRIQVINKILWKTVKKFSIRWKENQEQFIKNFNLFLDRLKNELVQKDI